MNEVYTSSGKILSLGAQIGKGGEGEIKIINGYKDRLAKIYSIGKGDTGKNTQLCKLSEILEYSQSPLLESISFPRSLLYDANHNVVGYGMNKIKSDGNLSDVCTYNPSNPKFSFSNSEKVQIGINICKLLKNLHNLGICYGDFHEGNILVNKTGEVFFVDIDTVQFTKHGKTYRCNSCFPGYASPETLRAVKGYTYATCPNTCFTEDTDNWCLAVHIFKLLFNGASPYSVNIQGNSSESVGFAADNILVEKGITPFNGGKPADWVPDTNAFPNYINTLFTRAFVTGHTNPKARPKPEEWQAALRRYKSEMCVCSKNSLHGYWKKNTKCPYCEADSRHASITLKYRPSPHANSIIPPKAYNATVATNNTAKKLVRPCVYHSNKDIKRFVLQWFITLISSALIQTALFFILKNTALDFLYDSECKYLIILILMIGGFAGTCIYNSNWSSFVRNGPVKWYDYPLSILCSIGGIAALTSVLALIALGLIIVAVILAIIVVVLVVAVIISIISESLS